MNHPALSFAELDRRLRFPSEHSSRIKAVIARTARYIKEVKFEWYFAKIHRNVRLRLYCGHVVVIAAERQYIWLALDESSLPASTASHPCWCWDEPGLRPADALDAPYPRFKRPPSRNGFFIPALDPEGQNWKTIEYASFRYIENAAANGRAPDHRTRSDLGLCEAIDQWLEPTSSTAFDDRVSASRTLSVPSVLSVVDQFSCLTALYSPNLGLFYASTGAEIWGELLGAGCLSCVDGLEVRRTFGATDWKSVVQ